MKLPFPLRLSLKRPRLECLFRTTLCQGLRRKRSGFFILCMAWAISVPAQDNALVAKSIERVVSDGRFIWALADSGTSYSVVDFSLDPPGITTYQQSLPGLDDGLGRTRSILARYHHGTLSDSITVSGLVHLDRNNGLFSDSLLFTRGKEDGSASLSATHFTDMAIWRDTVFLATSQAGWTKVPLNPEGERPVAKPAVSWQGFAVGKDSLFKTMDCTFNAKECKTSSLDALAKKVGGLETIQALALDTADTAAIVLWLGTGHGLYKHVLGTDRVSHVGFPGVDDSLALNIQRIVVDSKAGKMWVFTSGRYAISLDRGISLQIPPDIGGLTKVSELQGFNATPDAFILGDTTWVNFKLDKPGLVLFNRDTVLRNEVAKGEPTELGDILLDAADSLAITREEGRLQNMTSVSFGAKTWVVLASSGKGLFFRDVKGGKTWSNISRQKTVQNGLMEVITFPTLFTAAKVNGEPEYVRIGYRLKKDSKVTITILNHAMEKVKTLVSQAPRKGGGARSEDPVEDRWDGLDSHGRRVSVGTYYVRVQSSNGDGGWGKILAVAGRQ
jgi:hypothetical protein